MPTGYTQAIEDDENFTFEQYVWQCARAFTHRDWSVDLRTIFLGTDTYEYQLERAQEATQEFTKFVALTEDQRRELWVNSTAEDQKFDEEYQAKRAVHKARYESMLAKVNAWVPPTPGDYFELKRFMVDQINIDLRMFSHERFIKNTPTFEKWEKKTLSQLQREVEETQKALGEAIALAQKARLWIQHLNESVPHP